MRTTALLFGLLICIGMTTEALAQSQRNLACYEGAQNPLAAPETAQFEFLLGSFQSMIFPWDPTAQEWLDEPIRTALWEGEYILDGTGISDYWYGLDPTQNPDTGRGINTRIYDSEKGEWNMTWNSWGPGSAFVLLKAKMIDGVLTMWQAYPEAEQKRVSEFIVNSPDHWTRFTYLEQDNNKVPLFKIESYRMPCEE